MSVRTLTVTLVVVGLSCWPAVARKLDVADVPIVVGGAKSAAACPGEGEVVGLDPQGDNFLSVRSGPGGRGYRELDRIHSGQRVKICDLNGPWLAVVYIQNENTEACDVGRPWGLRQTYTGPCRQGWVFFRYIDTR